MRFRSATSVATADTVCSEMSGDIKVKTGTWKLGKQVSGERRQVRALPEWGSPHSAVIM